MKKVFAIIITLSMIFTLSNSPIIVQQVFAEDISISDNTAEVKVTSLRMSELEKTMNSAVFYNNDGTYTLELYGMDIKYVNDDGKIADKTNYLVLDEKQNYYNPDNDIITTFPKNLELGVSLQYEDYAISMKPVASNLSEKNRISEYNNHDLTQSIKNVETSSKITSIIYQDVFSDSISIKYSAMFNGLKEEIILEKYTGTNEFQFIVNTNGLELVELDGSICIIDNDKQLVIGNISDIIVFDKNSNYTDGYLNVKEIEKSNKYLINIIVPEEYLTSKATVYPVTIDPSIVITVTNADNKEIQDAPVYSGLPTLQAGNSYYSNVGLMPSSVYGYSRTLTKFPGLMENIKNLVLTESRITSVVYNLYCVEAGNNSLVHIYEYPGSTWDEETVSYTSSGMATIPSLGPYLLDSVNITPPSGTTPRKHTFNITNYVKKCLSGTADVNKGVLLKNASETMTGALVRFASTEYSDSAYWPSVSVTYTGLSSNDFCFYVYDEQTGEPILGASVYAYRPKTYSGEYPVPTAHTTNAYGAVVFNKTTLPFSDTSYTGGYGINIMAPGYAQYTSDDYDVSSGNIIHSISMKKENSYPNYNSPFTAGTSYVSPSMSQNQHWGWRYNGNIEYHTGVDIKCSKGTSLYSVTNSGTVIVSKATAGAGNYVITKSGLYYTAYLHMNTRAVSAGSAFSSRINIGTVGGTGGGSDGLSEMYTPHLHISVSTDVKIDKDSRKYLDPLAFIPFQYS